MARFVVADGAADGDLADQLDVLARTRQVTTRPAVLLVVVVIVEPTSRTYSRSKLCGVTWGNDPGKRPFALFRQVSPGWFRCHPDAHAEVGLHASEP
ncbi:MAG TPA: hypothetical protein VFI46_17090 [Jiangellaceae bacterium]|nr:hypothetical protein [Jiangellaceae bacterium]